TEPAAATFVVLAAWLAAALGHRRWGLAAAAAVLGLGILIRPQSLLCAPLLPLLPQGAAPLRKLIARGAAATGVAILVVLPWTYRNCRVMDGCAFVSTNAGWNLAIGAFPRATGRFSGLSGDDGCRIVTGQVQQDRCWMRMGLSWIAADPGRWLGLVDDKLAYTFDHESFAIGYLGEADPTAWPEERKRLGRGVASWSHRALLALATFGVVPGPSRKRPASLLTPVALGLVAFYAAATPTHPFWPLAILLVLVAALRVRALDGVRLFAAGQVLTVALTHAVFFGEDRYHMVLTPWLALLAACAFDRDQANRALGGPAPSG
ncbi:MAG: hypothetical protein KC731_39350, partial [Myxococcales bacterium]|nr:hypothetical protein [Myxococcales bacterium]